MILTFGIISLNVLAQADETKVALNELNGLYASTYRFTINSEKQLEVAFFNGSGHYRNDIVYLDFLDPDMIIYNSEEKAISIRCSQAEEKCIDKEIFKLDVLRHSSRINLKEEDAAQSEQVIALLQMIITLHAQSEKDNESQMGETRRKR